MADPTSHIPEPRTPPPYRPVPAPVDDPSGAKFPPREYDGVPEGQAHVGQAAQQYHLAALRKALTEPGEHRLYRAGKLPGLFPVRLGACIDGALAALAENHLEVVRTEAKGRQLTEWVRITPAGVEFVHQHDSPRAILEALQQTLGTTRAGVPVWMQSATEELLRAFDRMTRQQQELLEQLRVLHERVEGALARLDLRGHYPASSRGWHGSSSGSGESQSLTVRPPVGGGGGIDWTDGLIRYLDRRRAAGGAGACPLADAFQLAHSLQPELTVAQFHQGLHQLAEARQCRLVSDTTVTDWEYALVVSGQILTAVVR